MASRNILGYCEGSGKPIEDESPPLKQKVRIFDPARESRYVTAIPVPHDMTIYNKTLQLTHLVLASGYTTTTADTFVTSGGFRYELETMVIEIGAATRGDYVVAARTFGHGSMYDQAGVPKIEPPSQAISAIVDIGCQQAEKIVAKHRFIKKIIFMTSNTAIYNGVHSLCDWLENGFPATFEGGMQKSDFLFLKTNLSYLEQKGVDVLFWLVKPEFIVAPHCLASSVLDDFLGVKAKTNNPMECACSQCIMGSQHREVAFAKTGKEACPCQPCRDLIRRYGSLKKGEKFPLTNNAGKEVMLEMEVDGELIQTSTRQEEGEGTTTKRAKDSP